jgi:SAM-dependent methyltransferase
MGPPAGLLLRLRRRLVGIDQTMPHSATQGPTEAPSTGDEPVERFDPDQLAGELVEAEHLLRYYWAAETIEGKDVLDAGCGTGYGAAILAAAGARRYVGVDVSSEAIERARAAYAELEHVEWLVADARSLPFEEASFDVVTCFETIEHVDDQAGVVRECARVLRPGGMLLISSPNRDEYPPGNPFHVHELTPAELDSLLAQQFSHVVLVRQHNWLTSAALADDEFGAGGGAQLEVPLRKLQPLAPGRELYTLAIASDAEVRPVAQAVLTHGLEVRRWLEKIEYQNAELERHKLIIRNLGNELARVRGSLAATERQLLLLRDQRSTAMGQLERRTYWLELGEINLDAWMQRRPFRFAFRALLLLLRVRRKLTGRR